MPDQARALACPRCDGELAPEIFEAFALARCAGCGGVWLDRESFRAACLERDEDGADADARVTPDDVRYLRCPLGGEVMNRMQFARVSGVVIDVCRAHGAWLDAGELHTIRRFIRTGGAARHEGTSRTERLTSPSVASTPGRAGAAYPHLPLAARPDLRSYSNLIDVLAGIPDPWDIPQRRMASAWFLRAAVLAISGAGLVSFGVWSQERAPRGVGGLGGGVGAYLLIASFVAAARAFHQRRRERAADRPDRPPR